MLSNVEIGSRIETRRMALGMTLDDVALQIGVHKSTIQRYEKGQIKKIKLPVIESIAAVLNVNPAWIIGNVDDPTVIVPDTKETIKAAFWGGDKDLSPEEIETLWEDVRSYQEWKTAQMKQKKKE